MSNAHTDVANAARTAGYNLDDIQVAYDSPGDGWADITDKLNLSRGTLRDLRADGLEVYYRAPTPPKLIPAAVEKVKSAIAAARGRQ